MEKRDAEEIVYWLLRRKKRLGPAMGLVTNIWFPLGTGVMVTGVQDVTDDRLVLDWRDNPAALFVFQEMRNWLPTRVATRAGGTTVPTVMESEAVAVKPPLS